MAGMAGSGEKRDPGHLSLSATGGGGWKLSCSWRGDCREAILQPVPSG